jgi:hypothetical protein
MASAANRQTKKAVNVTSTKKVSKKEQKANKASQLASIANLKARLATILSGVSSAATEFVGKLDAFFANKRGFEQIKAASAQPGNSVGSHMCEYFCGVFATKSVTTVLARLNEMKVIVGGEYVPADKGMPAAAVLARLVGDVVQSREIERFVGLANLCRDYLQAFDLALYVRCSFLDRNFVLDDGSLIPQDEPIGLKLGASIRADVCSNDMPLGWPPFSDRC